MKVVLPDNIMKDIKRKTKKEYPLEACGILVGKSKEDRILVKEFRETKNLKPSRNSFSIDPELVFSIFEEFENSENGIVGFYHSHPDMDAKFSKKDKKFMKLWNNIVWLIGSTDDSGKLKNLKSFQIREGKILESEVDW